MSPAMREGSVARNEWAPASNWQSAPFTPFRFTVDEYHHLAETGILSSENKVELLHGILVKKTTLNPPHMYALCRLTELFSPWMSNQRHIRPQGPITLLDSEPEPDFVIAKGTSADYLASHPRPENVEPLVEISDSSLRTDRVLKMPLYASNNIQQYWIVNLIEKVIEVHTRPEPDKAIYLNRVVYLKEGLVPVRLGEQEFSSVAVKDLLP